MTRALTSLVLILACGCDAPRWLVVDLRTDLLGGIEITMARTTIADDAGDELARTEVPLSASDDLIGGLRVAELTNVAPGMYSVRVVVLGPGGRAVLGRTARVPVAGSAAVTVLITRDCRGVECPAEVARATECVGGICVPPECTVEDSTTCPGARCAAASECAAGVACAEAECVSGYCLYHARDARCASGERCHLDVGCAPDPSVTDGGQPPDAASGCEAPCSTGNPCEIGELDCTGAPVCRSVGLAPPGTACPEGTCSSSGSCDRSCDCSPGTAEIGGACGPCGTERRTCTSSCQWGSWTCEEAGDCTPSELEYGGACENCGTRVRQCQSSCTWSSWACGSQGDCSPGARRDVGSVACGTCGTGRAARYELCTSECGWGWTATDTCVGGGYVCASPDGCEGTRRPIGTCGPTGCPCGVCTGGSWVSDGPC